MSDELVPSSSAEPTATPSAPSAPTTSGAPVAAPTTSTAPSAGPTFQPAEATVPSYRLREATEAYRSAQNQWTQKEAQYQAQLDAVQRQIQALVGVTPQGDQELEAVRQQFGGIYPGLAKLEARAEQLEALLERSGDLESQNDHYWQSYGRQTMNQLFEKAASSLGGPLTNEAKQALHSAFTGYVSSSPELVYRYTNDPSLIDEFWTRFTSSFIDPARRVAATTVAGRTAGAIPQDTPGGAPRATPAPNPANLDERMSQGWQQYLATAKSQGKL